MLSVQNHHMFFHIGYNISLSPFLLYPSPFLSFTLSFCLTHKTDTHSLLFSLLLLQPFPFALNSYFLFLAAQQLLGHRYKDERCRREEALGSEGFLVCESDGFLLYYFLVWFERTSVDVLG